MLSRAVFRSLPRSASRIASTTTRTSLRPSLQSPIRNNNTSLLTQLHRAAFTTSARRYDNISQELSIKLANEIALEKENTDAQHDSDAGVSDFLAQNDHWSLHSAEGEQDVLLTRSYDDEKISVSFSIVDFNTAAGVGMEGEDADEAFMDEEEELGTAQSGGANTKGAINRGGTANGNFKVAPEDSIAPADREELRNEEDDYDAQQAFPANVNVLVQRPGKGALRINLVTDNGRFTIHGVTHLPESITSPSPSSSTSAATSEANPAELLRSTNTSHDHLYTGPPFQQLDEEVQSMLEQYLDVRGINTALALFIPDFIDVKEQKEYLGWLERVKDFVE